MTHTKAWALIDQVGWCQRRYMKREGETIVGYCPLGAIEEVYGIHTPAYWTAVGKVRAAIRCASITGWNDAHGQTKERVVAALKEADV